MRENRFLYAVRFIACLAVITLHTRFPGIFGQAVQALARFAVPYFFAISGRYFLNSSNNDSSFIRKRATYVLKKILGATGIVYSIHLAFSLIVNLINGMTVSEWFHMKFNLVELREFLLYNSSRIIYDPSYTFDHLWFLFALIYVYALIFVFAPVLRKWYKGLIGTLLFFLFFGEALQTYYPIRPFGINICTWYIMRNWLFVGMPFVLIGILFADYIRDKVDVLGEGERNAWAIRTRLKATIGLLSGIVLSIAETHLIDAKEVHLGSLVIVLSLLFLSECNVPSGKYIWKVGKRSASNIYYFHVLIIAIIDLLSQRGLIPTPSMAVKPPLIMVICVILFYVIPVFAEKWLKMPSSSR